jgi:hypothetical protein
MAPTKNNKNKINKLVYLYTNTWSFYKKFGQKMREIMIFEEMSSLFYCLLSLGNICHHFVALWRKLWIFIFFTCS